MKFKSVKKSIETALIVTLISTLIIMGLAILQGLLIRLVPLGTNLISTPSPFHPHLKGKTEFPVFDTSQLWDLYFSS